MKEQEKIKFLKLGVKNKNKILILSMFLFLTTMIFFTYAWLQSDFVGNSRNINLTSAELTLSFRGTSNEVLADLAPGEYFTKTFEIHNPSAIYQTYDLIWENIENTFVNKNNLEYTIINTDTNETILSPRPFPSKGIVIFNNIGIIPNETQKYTLIITYVLDEEYNQLENADKYLQGDIIITKGSSIRTLESVTSFFIDGQSSPTLPSISTYTLDTTRSFCTDGSSLALDNGEYIIENMQPTTTCEMYFLSSNAADFTNPPYNLLVFDLNGGSWSLENIYHHHLGDEFTIVNPTHATQSFLGWEFTGNDTSYTGNTITMGSTYSYFKAVWSN